MSKRIISALLLGAMLISLAACGGSSGDDTKETDDSAVTTDAPETYPADIAPADYQLDFTIYSPDVDFYKRYFFSDGSGTDAMSKALYERELAVEDHLGVNIDQVINGPIGNVSTTMQQMVMTGDDTYQMVLTHCISGVSQMVVENLLFDFNNFEYVDMTKDWWNQQAVEALSVNGHCFYGVSDYMIPDANCVLVNLEMLEKLNVEDPYQLVRDGKWTIDKMMELMSYATKDNGDGKWDHLDTYGLTTPDDFYCNSFTFSSEIKLVSKNADGEFVFAFDTERTYDVVQKVDELLTGPDTYFFESIWDGSPQDRVANDKHVDISKGRSLFNIFQVGQLFAMRDIELDFGVLPFPKYEESQDNYYTNDWSGFMAVPKTVDNDEMVGKVIELLGFYSEDVRYAYYEVMLGEKLTRDPASKEMLDIIFDNISYDAGVSYFGFSGGHQIFFWPHTVIMYGSGAGGFSSFLASNKTTFEAGIADFNQKVAAIENAAE